MTPFWAEYDRLDYPFEKAQKPKDGAAAPPVVKPRVLIDLTKVIAAEDIIRDKVIVGTALYFGRDDYVQVAVPSGAIFGALRGLKSATT